MYDIDGWMVAWDPNRDGTKADRVKVGPHPDETGWSTEYRMSAGCAFTKWHSLSEGQKITQMLIDFHDLVVADGIDPQVAHREFAKIKGFADAILGDIKRNILPDD